MGFARIWSYITGLTLVSAVEILLDGGNKTAYVKRGDNVDLVCGGANKMNISLVLWKTPGNKTVPASVGVDEHSNTDRTQSLHIASASFSDSGIYSCESFSFTNSEFIASCNLVVRGNSLWSLSFS